ncbi:hypothetical protein BHE74_00028233 [Ensete ventricosum]|nr:hypothetical protein BHE74_00028233 [Ensete ventricosum]
MFLVGHINHSIFWNNLKPVKASAKNLNPYYLQNIFLPVSLLRQMLGLLFSYLPKILCLCFHKNYNEKILQEGGGEPPDSALGWAINTDFGSLEALVQKMNAEGAALQGSGWVWLALDKGSKKLSVQTTANQVIIFLLHCHLQDPLVTKGLHMVPLLGIDVREHAYYLQFSEQLPTLLQYKNVRPDYLKNIWNVINWKYASEVYEKESG